MLHPIHTYTSHSGYIYQNVANNAGQPITLIDVEEMLITVVVGVIIANIMFKIIHKLLNGSKEETNE